MNQSENVRNVLHQWPNTFGSKWHRVYGVCLMDLYGW